MVMPNRTLLWLARIDCFGAAFKAQGRLVRLLL
jgi:hypothetical protein